MQNAKTMPAVIHPIQFREIAPDESLVFLAGPIRGADVWRDRAIELLNVPGIVFASPDRLNDAKVTTPGYEDFVDRQRQWEQYYLRKAVELSKEKRWAVLFWLERQTKPLAEENRIQKKAFGAISHLELGQIMVTHPDSLVVGISPEYNERSTLINDIRKSDYLDLSKSYDPKALSSFEVSDTLEETCARTKALVNPSFRN